jgi:hypothetical protein
MVGGECVFWHSLSHWEKGERGIGDILPIITFRERQNPATKNGMTAHCNFFASYL